TYSKVKLLEISSVTLPSCPTCTITSKAAHCACAKEANTMWYSCRCGRTRSKRPVDDCPACQRSARWTLSSRLIGREEIEAALQPVPVESMMARTTRFAERRARSAQEQDDLIRALTAARQAALAAAGPCPQLVRVPVPFAIPEGSNLDL